MKIEFNSKEESKKQQLESFLTLSKSERVRSFFKSVFYFQKFPIKKDNNTDSFILIKKHG
jgi:hypothetical protein